MKIIFNKYEGAGNDFVIFSNTPSLVGHSDTLLIKKLCDRHFGIGADGLMLIEECRGFDFRMFYFNSDGSQGAMCGNGARCAAHFAMRHLTGFRDLTFMADDGPHTARPAGEGKVEISITDVNKIRYAPDGIVINTGVPHAVVLLGSVPDLEGLSVRETGREIRFHERFAPAGTNANFAAAVAPGALHVRTYERGVEDETLACGTGVTACALLYHLATGVPSPVTALVRGGDVLSVSFEKNASGGFENVRLRGPADFVFTGTVGI